MAAKNSPPTYDKIAQHEVFPTLSHDKRAKYNFITNLNRHLAHGSQSNSIAFEQRVQLHFKKQTAVMSLTKKNCRLLWKCDNKQAVHLPYRQASELAAKAEALNRGKSTLIPNKDIAVSPYLKGVENFFQIEHPKAREIIHLARKKGYQIGIHPSYKSFLDEKCYKKRKKNWSRLEKNK